MKKPHFNSSRTEKDFLNSLLRLNKKKYFLLSIIMLLISSFTYAQNTAVLYGTCSDTSVTQIQYCPVNPFRWSVINQNHRINVPRKNNHFEIKRHVQSPQLFNIYPPRYSWSQLIYITPGDSVLFQIVPLSKKNTYKIVFSGKDAAQYNYDLFMRKAFFRQNPYFKKGGDLNQYKQALLAYKNRQMDSLTDYVRKHKVSKDFIDYAKAEINNEYVYRLFIPLDNKYVSRHDLPSGYLQDAIPEKNKVSRAYKVALADKYIYNYTHSPVSNFDSVYTNIMYHFSGQDRAFLLSTMIGYYALQQKTEYQSKLLHVIQEAPKYVHNQQYLNYIHRAEQFYTMINHPFPDSVLTHTYLISFNGNKKITLKELLNHYKGKALYLDFWASWCAICRFEITGSHPARQYLAQKDVKWICISRDTDEKAWLKAVKKDSVLQNQYLLCNVPTSPLLKYLNINYVPRYVLMDNQHDIKEPNAPHPASYFSNKNFEKLKKSIQEITGK